MNYYEEIKEKLINNEVYTLVKDYSKERHRVITYYEVGKLLSEAGKKYGEDIIGKYSEKLKIEVGRKYDKTTLKRMRQFYKIFKDKKGAPAAHQLTWSHYIELIPIEDIDKINYYIKIVEEQNLSRNALRERIKNKEYERLPLETKNKLITKEELYVTDIIPEPVIIKNKSNIEVVSEKILQRIIVEDIEGFMKELGNSFSFIGSEYKIKIGNIYNYIDLLLFNYEYNSFVVIELKVTPLKKEHIGQIEVYMNYIDKNVKEFYHNKTIGIILVKKNNKFIIEYTSDKRILSKEYELVKE